MALLLTLLLVIGDVQYCIAWKISPVHYFPFLHVELQVVDEALRFRLLDVIFWQLFRGKVMRSAGRLSEMGCPDTQL